MENTAIQELVSDIGAALGYKNPPVNLSPAEAAQVLGAKEGTLEVWRCTGTRNIPYIKIGRIVRYPVKGLAEYMSANMSGQAGE